jgi:hypothetical protein
MDFGAEGRNRTGTTLTGQRILSPLRLPIPPLRQGGRILDSNEKGPALEGKKFQKEFREEGSKRNGFQKRPALWATWRRRADLNRWIKVLQTSALPLGYVAENKKAGRRTIHRPDP